MGESEDSLSRGQADDLFKQGYDHLSRHEIDQAAECFRVVAETDPQPAVLNNWALCRFAKGDSEGAFNIIRPLLRKKGSLLPFTKALASRICTATGNTVKARRHLKHALADFELGAQVIPPGRLLPPDEWLAYIEPIKLAAGELGQHQLVLDLHRRWSGTGEPLSKHTAAVAAFNLERFDDASRYWSSIKDRSWAGAVKAHKAVADLALRRIVPRFDLHYDIGRQPSLPAGENGPREYIDSPEARVHILSIIFEGKAAGGSALLGLLIENSGEWGKALGQNLLGVSDLPMHLKIEAAEALVSLGVYGKDEPIPMVDKGKRISARIKVMPVLERDPEAEKVLREAIRQRDSGNTDQAYRTLSDLMSQRGIAYPPAMITLANLMRERGELVEAVSLLKAVEQCVPADPVVQFNLAGCYAQMGDPVKARDHFSRIDPTGQDKEFRDKHSRLKAEMTGTALFAPPDIEVVTDMIRETREERPISTNITVASALRCIPVQWLDAIAFVYGTEKARLRPDRESSVLARITDPEVLADVLGFESSEVRATLSYLLENGGIAKVSSVERRFGSMDGDGYYWNEVPPGSPLGRLRILGLAYVGRSVIDGKRHKVAVVPVDLRQIAALALDQPPSSKREADT